MPATVIAISAQTGSGGFAIAHGVAEALRFRYYDWEITSEAASRAGVSPNDVIAAEHVPGFMERMMRRLAAVSTVSVDSSPAFNEPTASTWSLAMQSLTSDDYRQFIERIVLELAERGDAVIVGHAGQYTLRKTPGVLRVLVHGSVERRAERLAAEQETDLKQALETVKASDRDRRELLRRLYRFDWLDSSNYDLTLSTDHLPLEFATDTIVTAAKAIP